MSDRIDRKNDFNNFFRNAIMPSAKTTEIPLGLSESEDEDPQIIGDKPQSHEYQDQELVQEVSNTKRYRDAECSHCFQLLPKNQMQQHILQEMSGASSGSSWSSQATSSTGANGRYNGSRIGASRRSGYSFGRTYFKNRTIWLCPDCEYKYLQEEPSRRKQTAWAIFWAILMGIAGGLSGR